MSKKQLIEEFMPMQLPDDYLQDVNLMHFIVNRIGTVQDIIISFEYAGEHERTVLCDVYRGILDGIFILPTKQTYSRIMDYIDVYNLTIKPTLNVAV